MMLRIKSKTSARRGSALIEFALVALELMVVILAIFEFSRMALVYTNLASVSRIAARYAITHGVDRSLVFGTGGTNGSYVTGDICGAAGVLGTYGKGPLTFSKLTCTVTPATGGGVGSQVQVVVTYPYDPWVKLPLKVTLRSTSEGIVTY